MSEPCFMLPLMDSACWALTACGRVEKESRFAPWISGRRTLVAPSTELRKWFGHDPKRWSSGEFLQALQSGIRRTRKRVKDRLATSCRLL